MRHCLMIMLMVVGVLTMNMDMRMGVGMLMGVDSISMTVFVEMGMIMLMGVLQFDGVFNHKICADNHYSQGNIELDCGPFAQNQHTKSNTQKRSYGIVGACLGCTQIFLGHNIEIDTQTIGNKAKHQYTQHPNNRRDAFSNHQGNNQTAKSRESAFNNHDFNGAFVANHSGAVVFNTPAQTRTEYKQRTDVELKGACSLEG